jgi:tyrosine-protein kinase Etk/Wzc
MRAMRTCATDQNPNLSRLQREIDVLQKQLTDLQNSRRDMQPGDIELPTGRFPAGDLDYTRKLREVRYHESLFELLSKRYEAGRIDEAKSAPIVQVIDRAVPPDKKSGPPRMLMILGFGVIGLFIACLWVFVSEAFVRMRRIPESASKLTQLRDALHVRLY